MGSKRREELLKAITARLRRVCTYMTHAEFAEFVAGVARITEKYEQRATRSSAERQAPHHPGRAD